MHLRVTLIAPGRGVSSYKCLLRLLLVRLLPVQRHDRLNFIRQAGEKWMHQRTRPLARRHMPDIGPLIAHRLINIGFCDCLTNTCSSGRLKRCILLRWRL